MVEVTIGRKLLSQLAAVCARLGQTTPDTVRISRSHVRAFAPILLFGAFLILFFGMTSALHLNTSVGIPGDAVAVDELRARIFWGASFVALGVVTCWSLALAAATTATYLTRRASKLAMFLTLLVAFALGIGTRYGGSGAQSLLLKLQNNTNVPISKLTGFMNVAVASAIVLFVVSCVALGSMPKGPLTALDLRQRIFDLRVLLFSSAALLVSGVTEIFFLFDWPRHVKILAADPQLALRFFGRRCACHGQTPQVLHTGRPKLSGWEWGQDQMRRSHSIGCTRQTRYRSCRPFVRGLDLGREFNRFGPLSRAAVQFEPYWKTSDMGNYSSP